MVTGIIPAYNEGKRIDKVLEVLKQSEMIDEIIVVNDGSSDETDEVAMKYTENVISLDKNLGKGGAIIEGIKRSTGDIILLLDADLIGLKNHHIVDLLTPILSNEADTTVGVFSSGRFYTDLAQKIAPFLSGQRAIKREVLKDIHNLEITKYGFEVAFTHYISKNHIRNKKVLLDEMSHVMKEEKEGLLKGFTARIKMYGQIVKVLSIAIKKEQYYK